MKHNPTFAFTSREKLSDDPHVRWTDRITPDGTWPSNLYQFYSRVIQRLSEDLKVPFELDKDLFRKGETIVHEAVREALVNALIHADYRGMGGVVVEKYRDRIELSNPGCLLVPPERIFQGGVSECRNRSLQTMFMMIGAGEKAGSGIDKIRRGWASQNWSPPEVEEQIRLDRVRWLLPMTDPDGEENGPASQHYRQGKKEGMEKGRIATARIMKQAGEPVEKIVQYTQLTVDEVEGL
uniref:ATP-dependent DNA helicase RecG n=1 Tax=Candidatus Kentrum sp. FM TaxID=2126340 RepID=A0A450T7W2_9GAMM|nr:MAG: ATP-dependent DNA helicase RecG [Candidatus Kentron sp. FM]VFJ62726.1 MAG: ATP-dependent DNA helicase RecG [Candidatus Kentron sp. FM]VFK14002.1 MAG: ATP-dependent DNA helicase RecG [Candidatus Kentron sp. FM]